MLINDLPLIMLKCLFITIFIELAVAFILKVEDKKDFLNILLVNIMTNPIVVSIPVWINIKFGILERNISLAILEILTIILEGFIYKKFIKYKKINPFVLSFILNGSSFFIGEIINRII